MLNPVAPPPLLKPVINLIDSVNQPVDLTAGRWVNGTSFRPWPNTSGWADDPCNQRVTSDQTALGPGVWVPYGGNAGNGLGTVDYRPPLFRIYDQASTFGFALKDYADRALAMSDVGIYKQVEAEFWSGSLAQSSGFVNPYLTNPATVQNLSSFVTGGTPSVRRGVEILDQALADYGLGARGIIHMRREGVPRLTQDLRRDGNAYYTANDNLVVPGVGYPNTGPGGAAAGYGKTWLFATGWVDVQVDPPKLFPDPLDYVDGAGNEDMSRFIAAAMDRSLNAVVVRAERYAAARFDPQCHFAIQVALDT